MSDEDPGDEHLELAEETVDEVDAGEPFQFEDDSEQGFFDHKGSVFCVATSPSDPTLIATGGEDDLAYLWRASTGERVAQLSGHTDSVVAIGFSASGQVVATGGMDGSVRLWKADTGVLIASVDGPAEVTWLKWHPVGPVFAVGYTDGSVVMYNAKGDYMVGFAGHATDVLVGQFTPDGKHLITGDESGLFIYWDPKTGQPLQKWQPQDARFVSAPITAAAVYQDGQLAIVGSAAGEIRVLQLTTGKIVASMNTHEESVEAVGFCLSMPLMATASVDGKVIVWDTQSQRTRFTLQHDDAVVGCQWLGDSPYLASISLDRTVRIWDARNGQAVRTWKGHQEGILAMSWSPDCKQVVTVGDDKVALVFRW